MWTTDTYSDQHWNKILYSNYVLEDLKIYWFMKSIEHLGNDITNLVISYFGVGELMILRGLLQPSVLTGRNKNIKDRRKLINLINNRISKLCWQSYDS